MLVSALCKARFAVCQKELFSHSHMVFWNLQHRWWDKSWSHPHAFNPVLFRLVECLVSPVLWAASEVTTSSLPPLPSCWPLSSSPRPLWNPEAPAAGAESFLQPRCEWRVSLVWSPPFPVAAGSAKGECGKSLLALAGKSRCLGWFRLLEKRVKSVGLCIYFLKVKLHRLCFAYF